MNLYKCLIVTLLGVALVGCFEEKWEGFVYPDANNLTISKNIGIFTSLEACRDAAVSSLSSLSSIRAGDYECGLNCEIRKNLGGIKICEKTEQ